MKMRKKIIQYGNSKAIIIPAEFFSYYKMENKELIAFDVDIREKEIVLKPVTVDRVKDEKFVKDVLMDRMQPPIEKEKIKDEKV